MALDRLGNNQGIILMNQVFQKITRIVEKELSSSAHSMEHVFRVHDLCMHLAAAEMAARAEKDSRQNGAAHDSDAGESKRTNSDKREKDVDLDVLEAAVLLHDIARAKEDSDNSGNIDHAILGSVMAERILRENEYPEEKIKKVVQCIARHRFRSGNEPNTIEAKILFDADKLDILGAIGIARLFMVAGEYSEKTYADIPLKVYVKENLVGGKPNGRIKDTSKHSPNLEFSTKLVYIPEKLYTSKAKEIASERLEYMKTFFLKLKEEIDGKQ